MNNLSSFKLPTYNSNYVERSDNSVWARNFMLHNFREVPREVLVRDVVFLDCDVKEYLRKCGFTPSLEVKWLRYIDEEYRDVTNEWLYTNYNGKVLALVDTHSPLKNTSIHTVDLRFIYLNSEQELMDIVIGGIKRKELKPYVEQPNKEMFIIIREDGELSLKSFPLNDIDLDIDGNYNDDFADIHNIAVDKLTKGKGLCLFHGIMGSGKTSYIKYLTSKIKKRMIFLPPSLSDELSSPSFINLLLRNTDSVLIIEDAENALRARGSNGSSPAVSNILNISDGLLSDIMNIGIIATFNCDFQQIDPALQRKGRLAVKYEFGKLKREKAQKLSDKLGFKTTITEDMTLADIYGQSERSFNTERKTIGF